MKKLLFAGLAVLGLATPAFAQFSLTGRFEANYSTTLAPGLTAGVLGRLDAGILPSFRTGLLVRPFVQYSTDLVSSGALTVNGYARVRLPITVNLTPSSGFGLSVSPQVGVDLTYDAGSGLSLLAGLRALASVSVVPNDVPFGYGLDGYLEADYTVGDLTVYGGVSLDSLLPPLAWSLYLGGLYDLMPRLTFNPELSTDLSSFGLLLRFAYRL